MDCPSWSPWTTNDSEEAANGSLFVMYNNYSITWELLVAVYCCCC